MGVSLRRYAPRIVRRNTGFRWMASQHLNNWQRYELVSSCLTKENAIKLVLLRYKEYQSPNYQREEKPFDPIDTAFRLG
jgi:hypothetical protein